MSVDWPEYAETGAKQTPLTAEQVFERARQAVGPYWTPALADNLKRFECGYFDGGKAGAVVQLACALVHTGNLPQSEPTFPYGRIEFIPAAKTVIAPGWDWDAAKITYVDNPPKKALKNKGSPLDLDKSRPAGARTPGRSDPGRGPRGDVEE